MGTEKIINVLLIEDDEVDIMNVQRAFNKNKISNPLYVVRNGVEALEILGEKGEAQITPLPRVILLDVNMPKMGGIEFLQNLRMNEKLKSISVFVLTTSAHDNDKIAAYNLNVAGYILKPLSFESFSSAVAVLNNYWKLCEQL